MNKWLGFDQDDKNVKCYGKDMLRLIYPSKIFFDK